MFIVILFFEVLKSKFFNKYSSFSLIFKASKLFTIKSDYEELLSIYKTVS